MFEKPVALSVSRDIISDITVPVSRRNPACLSVYFNRYAGFDDENAFSGLMRSINEKLSAFGELYLAFTQKIPMTADARLIEKYEFALKKIDFAKANIPALLSAMDSALSPELTKNALSAAALRQAATTIIALYRQNEPSGNPSISTNFLIKQFFWIDTYLPPLLKASGDINPKVVYYGGAKKHESYFLIFASLMGCDVIIFDPEGKDDYAAVDRAGRFSTLVGGTQKKPFGSYPQKIAPPASKPTVAARPVAPRAASARPAAPNVSSARPVSAPARPAPVQTAPTPVNRAAAATVGKSVDSLPSIIVSLKTTEDILNDFPTPLSARVGYAGKPSPIVPAYFCRCVGIPDDSDDGRDNYFNQLFLLDKKLKQNKNGYIRVSGQLAAPSADELFALRDIDLGPGAVDSEYIDYAVFSVLKSGVLVTMGFKPLDNAVVKAFRQSLILYVNTDKTVNASKLKNFICKIIFWLNKYIKQLYKSLDFTETPKFVYYGEIKLHEACLLTALSLIGCDVLYLSPDTSHGAVFRQLDPEGIFSVLDEKPFSTDFVDFPTAEKAIRQSTVAYKASEQISGIIYGNDTGLFKPWQFEDYNAVPLTLKTTADELKLLWNEPAKMRQGFKAEGGSIYIPNLFAKVNGVNEDINEYWTTFADMSRAKSCVTIGSVPFTNACADDWQLNACARFFNTRGELDTNMVFASDLYKFGYLRTSLQQHILKKIAELLNSGSFMKPVDDRFKFRILLTVLKLDERFVNLINTFDFPADVPKLLVYSNNTSGLSDEDAIVIAFLNLMGMDIAIFAPTNYNNIENHLKAGCFDTFQLPGVNLQLNMPDLSRFRSDRKGIFSKIFNK